MNEDAVTYGSGNVFADLGLPNPEERLIKSKIACTIQEIIVERGLSQKDAAALMGIDQPRVSKIIRGRLAEFSTEWLLARLLKMGFNVDIVIHRRAAASGRGEISVAQVG